MNNTNTSQLFDLTGQVQLNLNRSAMAYKEYIESGKKFLYARILKIYNSNIRTLLLEKGHLLADELQKDALALIAHYDVWTEKWNDHKEKLQPASDDEFAFPNDATFPREAARRLEAEYQRLKQLVNYPHN
jgi:ribonucleotide monophosphatase NagD (HAD superfamily)